MPKEHPKMSRKVANMVPTWVQVGAMLGPNRFPLKKKGVQKSFQKKGTPQDANNPLFPGQEAPGDGASRARFQQQKQQFGQQQQQVQQQLQKLLLEFMFCWKLLSELVFEVIVRFRFQEFFELLHLLEQHHRSHDLTRPGQRPGELCFSSSFSFLYL